MSQVLFVALCTVVAMGCSNSAKTSADGGGDDGGSNSCQASEECRPVVSECDIAESCEDGTCPEDILKPDGDACSIGECADGRCLPIGTLLGYWPFDETTGEEAEDLTGQTGNATLDGAFFAAGKLAGGIELDGLNDFVTIPSIAYTDQFALSFWFQIEPTNDIRTILAHGDTGDSRIVLRYSGGRGRLIVADLAGTEKTLNLGAEVADGQWHHLILNRSTDGTTEVFLDGGLRARENMMAIRPSGPVYLGRDIEGMTFAKMSLDDLRVYSSAFTIDDARTLVQEAGDTTPIVSFALADTFIESHNPDLSMEQADSLIIKSTPDLGVTINNGSKYREVFLRFDVSTIPTTNPIILRLYVINRGSEQNLDVRVSALVDDSWQESVVTYNQPPPSAQLGQKMFSVSDVDTYTEVDISEFVASAGSDGWLSLRLESRTYVNGDSWASFSSREGRYPPQLFTLITVD